MSLFRAEKQRIGADRERGAEAVRVEREHLEQQMAQAVQVERERWAKVVRVEREHRAAVIRVLEPQNPQQNPQQNIQLTQQGFNDRQNERLDR